MFDLENEIIEWKKSLRKNQALEDGYIEELESHLRDEIDKAINEGKGEEEAFNEAVSKIGKVENVGDEYYKSDTTHISKRPPWRTNPFVPALLQNYFILAFRSIRKSKTYSLINIIGLSISLVVFAFFALGFGVHVSADRFHEKADRIFGVVQIVQKDNSEDQHTMFLPAPLLSALENEFPEIETGIRISRTGRLKVQIGENVFFENNALFTDDNFFEIFSFKLINGNVKTALRSLQSIVISESVAKKYFGDQNPIGKELLVNNNIGFVITGIMENISRLSSLQFEILIPIERAKYFNTNFDSWKENKYSLFVLLKNAEDKTNLDNKFGSFVGKYWNTEIEPIKKMYLFPLTDYRLKSEHIASIMRYTRLPGLIISLGFGILLLIIASFNFINLSIARFMTRVKEIGLRKVIGAKRFQIVKQLMAESLLIAFISFLIAIFLFEVVSPIVASYMESVKLFDTVSRQSNSIFNYPILIIYIFVAAMFSGILSGIFPAFYVSGIKPISSLLGEIKIGKSKRRGTRILIVSQFFISTIILVFTGLFDKQLNYWVNNADFGYSRNNITVIELPKETIEQHSTLMNEISHVPGVEKISLSQNIPGLWGNEKMVRFPDIKNSEAFQMYSYGISYNFLEIFKIPIVTGRSFNDKYDDTDNIIINEAAAQKLGLDNPIGSIVTLDSTKYTVVGVTENFAFNDIGFDLPPAVFYLEKNDLNFMQVKLSSEYNETARVNLNKAWNSVFPNLPFESYSMNKFFEQIMSIGNSILGIFKLIGYMAVLFSYIGLIGLVGFMITRKTKEIGIRKILGASIFSIMKKIVNEYLRLVIIANIIAIPLIYYLWNLIIQSGLLFMQQLDYFILISTIILTIFIAVSFIIIRVYKSVKVNPSESLRYE